MIKKDYNTVTVPNRVIFDRDASRLLLQAGKATICQACARFRPDSKTAGPGWYSHPADCPGMDPHFSGCIMFQAIQTENK